MRLQRAPLWLLGAVLGVFVRRGCCASFSHSLSYFYLHLSEPRRGLPQSFIRSYLDDQPIARLDSLTGKVEPLVPWMEEVEKEGAFLPLDWVFRADLEKLSKLDRHAGGPHTWQVMWGCELREDGSKGGFLHYGYNGWDFISFDKETLRWVTAQAQAQKVKEKWEEDPGWCQGNKVYLDETCIGSLQRYQSYRTKTLEKIEPPVGKVTLKVVDERLEVLTCQAFGFYPKEIQAIWTRDGEPCVYETLRRNVAPNSDGTYYVQLTIDIDPKERDRFRCHLEHGGLQEPLDLAWKEETAAMWWILMGIVAGLILGAVILFLIYQRRKRKKNFHCKETPSSDQVSGEKLHSPTVYCTEDETQSQHEATTPGGQRPKEAPKDTASTLPNGEWKQFEIAETAAVPADVKYDHGDDDDHYDCNGADCDAYYYGYYYYDDYDDYRYDYYSTNYSVVGFKFLNNQFCGRGLICGCDLLVMWLGMGVAC